jgi:prevent-host-death family protein
MIESIAKKEYNMIRTLLQGVDIMQIKPSASIRQNYNEIAALCKSTGEPVYLTKNGEGDLVVMDIEAFSRREKMLKLREELLSVEEDRLAGHGGVTPDEFDKYLEDIIDEVEHGKETSI